MSVFIVRQKRKQQSMLPKTLANTLKKGENSSKRKTNVGKSYKKVFAKLFFMSASGLCANY